MNWKIFLSVALFFSCNATKQPMARLKTHPQFELNPKPERILLLNRYNLFAHKIRNNKEELFMNLIDSTLTTAAAEISRRSNIPTLPLLDLTTLTISADSSIYVLMKENNATHAIVINSFNVSFYQTNVVVTKTASGKDREAFYDIVSEIDFSFFAGEKLFKQNFMKKSRKHSSRTVLSGLLAAGPNIVSNKKDAWNITKDNLLDYLDLFFESE